MNSTPIKSRNVNLKELVPGNICFVESSDNPAKKCALEIIKQNEKDKATTVKILDKLSPKYLGKNIQTVSDSQIVIVPLDQKDIDSLLSSINREHYVNFESVNQELTDKVVKHKKEKISFSDIPEVIINAESSFPIQEDVIKIPETDEKTVEIIKELVDMGNFGHIHVCHDTIVCDSIQEPVPVKTRSSRHKVKPEVKTEVKTEVVVPGIQYETVNANHNYYPLDNSSISDEEIPVVIAATLFVGKSPQPLGKVVQEVQRVLPELTKPKIADMIRSICKVPTSSIKKTGEIISIRDIK